MTVFFDIDTQMDFMFPTGALYVPGAERILPAVAALNTCAASQGIPLISTTDAHTEDDPEFQRWPPHCILGTVGQLKPTSTLLRDLATIPNEKLASLPSAPQILMHKIVNDAFGNPNLSALLDQLQPDRCVVYGVVTELCVRCAAFGLLRRGNIRVELVTDAVRSLDEEAAARMFSEFTAAGGILTTASEALHTS